MKPRQPGEEGTLVLLRRASILKIGGPFQTNDGVIHVRARKFEELQLPSQVPESRDFR